MRQKLWISLLFLTITTGLVAIGCRHMRTPPVSALRANATVEERLAHADSLAKLGNWQAAGPIFRDLEVAYRKKGDRRNELYARVSRYRAELEFSDLQQLSEELRLVLKRPDVQADLALKQRCLETKGNVDLNFDGLSARPSFEELEKVAELRQDLHVASRASGELGILAFLEGNASEAKWRVGGAIAKAFFFGDVGAQIRYLSMMGQGLAENRRASEALWFLNRAIGIAKDTSGAGFPKIAVSGKASALTQLRRFSEARSVIDEGLRYTRRNNFIGFRVDMLAQAAQLAVAESNIPKAIELYEEASALADQIHFNRGLAEVNAQLASLYQRAGSLRKAEESADKSIAAHTEMREVYVLPHHLAVKATIEAALGDHEAAEHTFRTAGRIVGTMLQNTPTPGVKRAVIASMSEVFTGHFNLAITRRNLNGAYEVIEDARGRVAADRLRMGELPMRRSRPEIAAAERKLVSLQMRLMDAEDPSERQRLSESLLRLETEMTFDEPPDFRSMGMRPSLRDLQQSLASDETVLEYVLGDTVSHCLVITKDRVSVKTLPRRSTIDAVSKRFLEAIMKQQPAQDEGKALYAAVVQPVLSELTSNLIIIPDGSLHLVPFAALVDPQGKYVIERHALSYAPSGTVLALIRGRLSEDRSELLAVGNVPYGRGPDVAERSWSLFRSFDKLRRGALGALPGTELELKMVRSVLADEGGVVLSGDRATETNVKRETNKQYPIMHFAVHAFMDKDYPDRAGLLFASDPAANEDGLLQVREIRRLPLRRTSLVTLSACDTSAGRIEGQEGVSSIVYAFLYAGVRSAVASLWMVDDSATSEFMKTFYGRLAQRSSKAEALRAAQLQLIARGGERSLPLYWAAFNLMGEGADTIYRN